MAAVSKNSVPPEIPPEVASDPAKRSAFSGPLKAVGRALGEQFDLGALVQLRSAKLWIVLGLICALLIWAGYHFGDRYGLLVGFFCAVSLLAMIFLYDDWRVGAHFQGIDLEGRDPWGILRTTRASAKQLEMPMPLVREIASDTPFIFSAGLFASRLKIFYSTALLERLTPTEVQALINNELSRFSTGQTRTATAASAFVDFWMLLAGSIDAIFLLRFLFPKRFKRVYLGPVTWVTLPLMALFLRLVIRGRRMLADDQVTVATFGHGRELAEAFIKLDSYNKALPLDLNLAEAALFPNNPLASRRWSHWATVQPSIESRVRGLTGQFPP